MKALGSWTKFPISYFPKHAIRLHSMIAYELPEVMKTAFNTFKYGNTKNAKKKKWQQ